MCIYSTQYITISIKVQHNHLFLVQIYEIIDLVSGQFAMVNQGQVVVVFDQG